MFPSEMVIVGRSYCFPQSCGRQELLFPSQIVVVGRSYCFPLQIVVVGRGHCIHHR